MPTTASWISSKPDRCGGDACIRDTRITIWGLVAYRRLGMGPSEILQAVQGLTAADLDAAWEYAAAHAEEIDRAMHDNEDGEEGFVQRGSHWDSEDASSSPLQGAFRGAV